MDQVDKHVELIGELTALRMETEWVEFKVDNCDPEEIGRLISALANSACLHNKLHGYLVYGVEDDTRRLVGTAFQPSRAKANSEALENWLINRLSPRVDFRTFEVALKGVRLVVFEIDAARQAPISFCRVRWIRIGSSTRKLNDFPEKERKIWESTCVESFEEQIAVFAVEAHEVLDLLEYRSYFELIGIKLPRDKSAILSKLEEEKLVRERRGKYDIMNLGALLFARRLKDFDTIERKAPRVVVYPGTDRLNATREQPGNYGYAVGFEGLISYINDQLPGNEEIGQALRKEVKVYPEIAIRELVANALIHQDFSISGTGPLVEIFADRIEVLNPGEPLIDTLRFIDHPPQSRNEKLAHFMRRINVCEERGGGIDKVVDAAEAFQLPAPAFQAEQSFLRATLFKPRPFRTMDKSEKIRACYQHCCLKFVSNDYMTNSSLRGRFRIEKKNYSMVSRIIADAVAEGLVKLHDPDSTSKKHAKYVPYWA